MPSSKLADQMIEWDTLLSFAQFGLARSMPDWVPVNRDHRILNLGEGNKLIPGAIGLDYVMGWDAEQERSLSGFPARSVGGIYACHLLEHLSDPRVLLRECARVLVPGCPMNILVPHARSDMYLEEIDHKTPFLLGTWKHLLFNEYMEKGTEGLPFRIGTNILFGVAEQNLAIITQLIREPR
jgi:SAM-dependent methyltransferase